MLERFLGKAEKSALPKNQIEVICPLCGAVQREPRIVVTTFCRKCGEHLRIDKGGRVVASARLNPAPATVQTAVSDFAPAAAAVIREEPEAGNPGSFDSAALIPDATVKAGDLPLGLGHMMGFKDEEESVAGGLARKLGREEPPAGPPPPAPQSVLHRMKEQGYRQHYFKEVECFDCRNRFKVGRSARSTSCPSCGSLVCLEDFDINQNSTNPIRTRGDVLIRKTGNVQTTEVRCRDLKVFGAVAAAIECAGEFLVRATGTIIGEVRCQRFVVEKGCDVHFMNQIYAEQVEVRGRIFGHIQCSGAVSINASGWVHGDVTARAVSIEPGGQLDGAMNIVRLPGGVPSRAAAAAPAPTGENLLPFFGHGS